MPSTKSTPITITTTTASSSTSTQGETLEPIHAGEPEAPPPPLVPSARVGRREGPNHGLEPARGYGRGKRRGAPTPNRTGRRFNSRHRG